MSHPLKNSFWIALGILAFGLGIIGIFIPFLPTTPFLLLAAAFFLKGSNKLYQWLINHKIFGSYIRNFREHKTLTLRTKIITVSTLWATILVSVFFFAESTLLKGLLAGIGTGVTIHILHYKTLSGK